MAGYEARPRRGAEGGEEDCGKQELRTTASGCDCLPNMPSLLFHGNLGSKPVNNILRAEGNIKSGSDPEGEVLMDHASESESNGEGEGGEENGGRSGSGDQDKKHRKSVFQVAIRIHNSNTQWDSQMRHLLN